MQLNTYLLDTYMNLHLGNKGKRYRNRGHQNRRSNKKHGFSHTKCKVKPLVYTKTIRKKHITRNTLLNKTRETQFFI